MIPADPGHTPVRPRTEIDAFTNMRVWLALAVVAFGFGGVFAVDRRDVGRWG